MEQNREQILSTLKGIAKDKLELDVRFAALTAEDIYPFTASFEFGFQNVEVLVRWNNLKINVNPGFCLELFSQFHL